MLELDLRGSKSFLRGWQLKGVESLG